MKKVLALDFDGVLHIYKGNWSGPADVSGYPAPGAVEFCKQASERFDLVIFSCRCVDMWAIRAMKNWLKKHDFPEIECVLVKPVASVYLDDRGWTFTGTFPTIDEIDKFNPWWQ